MPTFNDGTTGYTIDKGLSKKSSPRVVKFSFGDGYEQRLATGINRLNEKFSATIRTRTKAEVLAIEDFLATLEGVTSFAWHLPSQGERVGSTTFTASNKRITAASGFNAIGIPDRLVVSGTSNNNGSYKIDVNGTNNDTILTVIEALVNEGPLTATVSAAISVVAVDWSVVFEYDNYYSLSMNLERVYES